MIIMNIKLIQMNIQNAGIILTNINKDFYQKDVQLVTFRMKTILYKNANEDELIIIIIVITNY